MTYRINKKRVQLLKSGPSPQGPVVYWMSREQRILDNWGLIFSQDLAKEKGSWVVVVFCLARKYLDANIRQCDFMLRGLLETVKDGLSLNIPFFVLFDHPVQDLLAFSKKQNASCLVTDFDPLRSKRNWKEKVMSQIDIPVFEVDSHNIVPCWQVSEKQEFAARTFRPKIEKQLTEFLEPYSEINPQPSWCLNDYKGPDWQVIWDRIQPDHSGQPKTWLTPGAKAGHKRLTGFLEQAIANYVSKRNDPNADSISHLSPYLHFGQIAPQMVALETVKVKEAFSEQKKAFFEELVIRRELSDNFCYYNSDYDSFQGLPRWSKESLEKHRHVFREYLYRYQDLEAAKTHDPLWNAAQTEMRRSGKMHGYMRMYWAKKILEWTERPEQAIEWAIELNDTYELDGRDPNGYVGILWSIGGLHDRPFKERPVFGKVRYMSFRGCQRKFDVMAYISKWGSERE